MKRTVVMALAAAWLLACMCTGTAQAQVHIDFGVFPSHGHGHHHHHHHGWHGHGWGHYDYYPNYWYRPPVEYVYVAPPPPRTVIYSEPVAVRPAPVVANRTVGTPTLAARPNPTANSVPAENSRGVTIRNPSTSGGNVAFMVDGQQEYELKPGQVKSLSNGSAVVVEFDRGGNFGSTERELAAGAYRFVVSDEGWDLEREQTGAWRTATTPAVRKNALPSVRR